MTGFATGEVLSVADTVINAVKAGVLKHFFWWAAATAPSPAATTTPSLLKKTPDDTVVLTLACGKYRFNDLDLGTIGGTAAHHGHGAVQRRLQCHQVALACREASAAASTNCR
jgi:hydroxylamine reductase